jgi:hypothetical protein
MQLSPLQLIKAIEAGDAKTVNELANSLINNKVAELLEELKQEIADEVLEDEDIGEARVKRINRIRGGVVQRRKIVAKDKAYRAKGDGSQSVVRMSASERRNRKLAQKKAARKRKAKSSRSMIKRKLTNRKRDTRGFNR